MLIFGNSVTRLIKYGISGGIGAIIDFALFSTLISLTSLNYLYANALSFSIGTLVVYYLQKNWTFERQSSDKSTFVFVKFICVVIFTYIFNNIILIICVELLYISPINAKIIQIVLSFIWGYSINKAFVFK